MLVRNKNRTAEGRFASFILRNGSIVASAPQQAESQKHFENYRTGWATLFLRH